MISKFFIERPVLANVLAILMVVIGAVSLMRLSVAQYPNVVPPTISVTTRYPGASALETRFCTSTCAKLMSIPILKVTMSV